MAKKAEEFLQESKTNEIKQKQFTLKTHKAKQNLLSQLIGYLIIVVGVLYTLYKFDNQEIASSTTIVLIILSLFFGGIFILIGKHYG